LSIREAFRKKGSAYLIWKIVIKIKITIAWIEGRWWRYLL